MDDESCLAYTKQRNKVRKLTRQAKKDRERKIAKKIEKVLELYSCTDQNSTRNISALNPKHNRQSRKTDEDKIGQRESGCSIGHFQWSFLEGR